MSKGSCEAAESANGATLRMGAAERHISARENAQVKIVLSTSQSHPAVSQSPPAKNTPS